MVSLSDLNMYHRERMDGEPFTKPRSAVAKLLKNLRKTGAMLSAPPEEQASFFLGWRRAAAPVALSRRTLLGSLACASAAAFEPATDGMFIALNSVLVNNRVKWPAFPQLAHAAGFPGVDVMLKPAMEAGPGATNALLKRLNLRPAAIDFPVEFRKDDLTFETDLAQLDGKAKFAADINCPRMVTYVMASSDTPREQVRELYKKRFSMSATVLARHNVRLGLEFLGPVQFRKAKYEFIWRMNDMLALAKECGENVGLLLDAWHWHHAGGTTDDILNAGRERIVHIHFDDAPNLPPEQIHDNQRLLPGEGVINLTGFLQALKQIGYRDALSVEVFGRMNNETPEAAARRGYEAASATVKKAGIAV